MEMTVENWKMFLPFNNSCPVLDEAYHRHEKRFVSIFGELVEHVIRTNVTEKKYHGSQHLINAAFLTFLLSAENDWKAEMMGGISRDIDLGERNFDFFVTDRTMMRTVAMLFHDYCYLGSKNDSENIEHSVDKFTDLVSLDRSNSFTDNPSALSRTVHQHGGKFGPIVDMIGYTLYDFDNPFPNPEESTTEGLMNFCFLRDIDQLTASVYFDQQMFDYLYHDIGLRFELSRSQFLVRNIEYYSGIKFYTSLCEGIFNQIRPNVIKGHRDVIL